MGCSSSSDASTTTGSNDVNAATRDFVSLGGPIPGCAHTSLSVSALSGTTVGTNPLSGPTSLLRSPAKAVAPKLADGNLSTTPPPGLTGAVAACLVLSTHAMPAGAWRLERKPRTSRECTTDPSVLLAVVLAEMPAWSMRAAEESDASATH
jgi:hypothetical protein